MATFNSFRYVNSEIEFVKWKQINWRWDFHCYGDIKEFLAKPSIDRQLFAYAKSSQNLREFVSEKKDIEMIFHRTKNVKKYSAGVG